MHQHICIANFLPRSFCHSIQPSAILPIGQPVLQLLIGHMFQAWLWSVPTLTSWSILLWCPWSQWGRLMKVHSRTAEKCSMVNFTHHRYSERVDAADTNHVTSTDHPWKPLWRTDLCTDIGRTERQLEAPFSDATVIVLCSHCQWWAWAVFLTLICSALDSGGCFQINDLV